MRFFDEADDDSAAPVPLWFCSTLICRESRWCGNALVAQ